VYSAKIINVNESEAMSLSLEVVEGRLEEVSFEMTSERNWGLG